MPTVCVVGPRDHGKSTLVRRLRGLPDLGQRAADGAEAAIVVLTGTGEVRLVDATDVAAVARVVLADPLDVPRGLVVVDATSGPARAGAALADLPLLGVRDIVVAVNKMDLAGWREDRYAAVRDALVGEADRLGLAVHAVVPVCARDATNVAERSATPWWRGPTLAGALDALPGSRARGGPLRLPVREVAERDGATLVVGRVESGSVKPGDDVLVLTTNRVTRVVSLEGTSVSAGPGEDARLVLADPLRLAPGDLIASPDSPAKLTAVFDADLWLFGPARDATAAVATGRRLTLVAGTREIGARILPDELGRQRGAVPQDHLDLGGVGDDVIVGHHVAVGRDDEARAHRRALARTLIALEIVAEILVERRIGALRRARLRLARDRSDVHHRGHLPLDEIGQRLFGRLGRGRGRRVLGLGDRRGQADAKREGGAEAEREQQRAGGGMGAEAARSAKRCGCHGARSPDAMGAGRTPSREPECTAARERAPRTRQSEYGENPVSGQPLRGPNSARRRRSRVARQPRSSQTPATPSTAPTRPMTRRRLSGTSCS